MTRTATIITPADHGRRMSLEEFEHAEAAEGHFFELGRGEITMVDVPGFPHMAQAEALRHQFSVYRVANPDKIYAVLSGAEGKLLVTDLQSERHPDLSLYRFPPEEDDGWATWVPEIVVEVVSHSFRHRDYEEKPEEYLQFGVREYWIVDAHKGEMLAYRRAGGRWASRVVRPGEVYKCPTLRGFELDLKPIFDAARAVGG